LEARLKEQAEEDARRRAWDEYNKQQAIAAATQAEEERRRAAWDEFHRQEVLKQEAARRAAEEEERKRQQAWAEYHAQQEALRQQQQAQATIAMAAEAQTKALQAQEAAARAAQAQQQLLMQQEALRQQQLQTVVINQIPPRPTTTVTTTTKTIVQPSLFPIKRLLIRAKRAARLIKKSALGTKPDPYIKSLFNGNYQRSTTLKATCNPKFEHEFEFLNVDKIDIIVFQVYDDCQLSKDDFLGEVRISGAECGQPGLVRDYELRPRELHHHKSDKVHGTLTLEFEWKR